MLEQFHFLIIEDDDVDILALKKVLIEIDNDIAFSVTSDGASGLELLRDLTAPSDNPQRVVVLLDLNLPGMGGHEFLANVRADAALRQTIVFVLSTSTDPRDIEKSYAGSVSGYLPKDRLTPASLKALLENFLNLVAFPSAD